MEPEKKTFYVSPTDCVFMFLYLRGGVLTYFIPNVAATVSYDLKELLDIRTVISHHGLAE